MSQLESIFLPGGLIALAFVVYWLIAFPEYMFHDMKMRSNDRTDNIVGLIVWCFVVIAVMTFAYIAYKLVG